ncbi:MAG: NAD(+)/NADH kinase [Armatimonadetes bacterium]|nr:NAD(+)/NADH kinase [Armatimonadota bacterium]MDE2206032.1 NAD(+)/NADH kinase [Armatimonadota bacterium]
MGRHVGIVTHPSRQEALDLAASVVSWLHEREVQVILSEPAATALNRPDLLADESHWRSAGFVVSLGGDGTILTAARLVMPDSVPILGVHMGRFGFIAEVSPANVFVCMEAALEGSLKTQDRMMIQAEILRAGSILHTTAGLNEVVIRSALSHIIHIDTWLAGRPFATFPADGLVLATPTGSTAYALSVGGPLVAPLVDAFTVAPICPHTLNARPLLVPASEVVEIEVEDDGAEVLVTVDGADLATLEPGDRVRARRASCITRLYVTADAGFYEKVRARYLYGQRVNG